MRLAFYAPMKSPDHPVPSGDRQIARSLMRALRSGGAEVTLASDLRLRDGRGNGSVQSDLMQQAEAEVRRLIAEGRSAEWQAWLSYHNYYKAPDLIGPAVCRALNIPYLLIEATRARKRLTGPWATFAAAAEAASDAAAVIFYFTERDAQSLRRDAPARQHLIHLKPFLDRADLPPTAQGGAGLLSVGMMREGDKLASYQIIAATLAALPPDGWHLRIVGDGPARGEVVQLMAPFGDKVCFLGALEPDALMEAYHSADLFLWPGVNEALGLVYLEAQAAGLPVIAQNRPGMSELLVPGTYPAPEDGPQALAARITTLMDDPAARRAAADAAREHVAAHHLQPAGAACLMDGIRAAVAAHG